MGLVQGILGTFYSCEGRQQHPPSLHARTGDTGGSPANATYTRYVTPFVNECFKYLFQADENNLVQIIKNTIKSILDSLLSI